MLRLSLIFILFSIYTASLICAARGEAPRGPIRPLTQEFVTVYESPDAKNLCCYSPGIARLDDGRLVAVGPAENASRHYASMAIDGDDLGFDIAVIDLNRKTTSS